MTIHKIESVEEINFLCKNGNICTLKEIAEVFPTVKIGDVLWIPCRLKVFYVDKYFGENYHGGVCTDVTWKEGYINHYHHESAYCDTQTLWLKDLRLIIFEYGLRSYVELYEMLLSHLKVDELRIIVSDVSDNDDVSDDDDIEWCFDGDGLSRCK